jgi:ABC-2 type transport system permease protein
MVNLLMKELKLGVHPAFYVLPFVTGGLMFIPGWLYFLVILYFCFITIPNIFAQYKSQNDLIFTNMLPVAKKDIVKAKISFIILLELLHIVVAMVFGMISVRLYPDVTYFFFKPTMGFWGLCFVMLAIFNIIFLSMFFKTAYKYGAATVASITAAMLFATGAEWLGVQNSYVFELFKGTGADQLGTQFSLLFAGIGVFAFFTIITYHIAIKRFEKVET